MATMIDAINSRLALALSVLALVGAALGVMDSRHASAGEVRDLANILKQSEIARLEYMISETQRRWKRIKRIPEADRTIADREDMADLEAREKFLLREMDRMEDGK